MDIKHISNIAIGDVNLWQYNNGGPLGVARDISDTGMW